MINIRNMTLDDIESVFEIEKSIFSIPWSKKSFESSISSKDTIYIVTTIDEKIVGYLGIYILGDQSDISNVCVHKDYRRMHIAEVMLSYIFDRAKSNNVKEITLEVRESNVAAISLYEKMGFKEIGIRKNYYQKPLENGLLMWKQNL